MESPSIMSHVSVGTNDLERALQFYDAVMPVLGARRILEEPKENPHAVAYGKHFPEFWVQTPHDGAKAATANGVHFGFMAGSKEKVREFYEKAVAAGGEGDGPPGPRALYGPEYYGCFVRDPDGHKIEAMIWEGAPI